MIKLKQVIVLILVFILPVACATSKDLQRVESKIDRLLIDTNRSTLEEIFGSQAAEITKRMEELDEAEKKRFETLQVSYEKGSVVLEDVREKMVELVGGNDREVATQSGIYIRRMDGNKLRAVPNGTRFTGCRQLSIDELPGPIKEKRGLLEISWGTGLVNDEEIIFPWDYTLSSFTREIVEATARRTAQKFIEMGGEKKWNRPIYIQVAPENSDVIKLTTTDSEAEILFMPVQDKELEEMAGGN